jgi:hypothetical protein
MTTRHFLAAVLGGIAMFIWTSIAHMVLPLGEAGVRELPNEQAILATLQNNIGEQQGFYIFPGLGVPPDAPREQKNQAMKRLAENYPSNSSGVLIYHPPGRAFRFGRKLTIEFITEVVEVILAVFLLSQTRLASFGGRVGFVTVTGILAAVATNVPYWNWYGFPRVYTVGYLFTQVIGFLCAGIVAALVLGKSRSA